MEKGKKREKRKEPNRQSFYLGLPRFMAYGVELITHSA